MKRESISQYVIKRNTWEHGYDKQELAKVLEEIYPTNRKEGFSFTISGDTLIARKSGEWVYWLLTTKDGKQGEFKSLDYVTENYPPDYFARQICFALMKTSFDASLSENQRRAENLIHEILDYYWAFESLGGQLDGTLPKAVDQVGRKLCHLSKADTREAFYHLFVHQALDPHREINLDEIDREWAKSRINWYLVHFANH